VGELVLLIISEWHLLPPVSALAASTGASKASGTPAVSSRTLDLCMNEA